MTCRIRTGVIGVNRCSASEPTSRETPSPGLGHTPRQRRAHRTGVRARTAGNRSSDASHWRLVKGTNPVARSHPPAARAQHPGTALARLMADSLLRRSMPGCSGCESITRIRLLLRLRTHKRKRPRMWIRGRSRSSEIGATDLRRESVAWNEAVQPCVTATQRAAARVAVFARRHGVGGDVEETFH